MARSRQKLDVLLLIVSDGDRVGIVQEDVRRHQGRVGKRPPETDSLPSDFSLNWVILEAHQRQRCAPLSNRVAYVPVHLTARTKLPSKDQTGRQHIHGGIDDLTSQRRRVLRHGDRVIVHDAVKQSVVLDLHEMLDSSQVIS